MAQIDEIKEEITVFRSLLITMIIVLVSLIGWIAQNTHSEMLFLAFGIVLCLSARIIWSFKTTDKKIKSLKDL